MEPRTGTLPRRAPWRSGVSTVEVRVEHLFTYPLKSGRAVESGEAFITASGFRDDRRFALANEDHDFVSLRSCPVLVHLGCTYRDGGWLLSWDGDLAQSSEHGR